MHRQKVIFFPFLEHYVPQQRHHLSTHSAISKYLAIFWKFVKFLCQQTYIFSHLYPVIKVRDAFLSISFLKYYWIDGNNISIPSPWYTSNLIKIKISDLILSLYTRIFPAYLYTWIFFSFASLPYLINVQWAQTTVLLKET